MRPRCGETVRAVLDLGVNLEDRVHHPAAPQLYAVDEQHARIAAARDEARRRGVPLVINARTDTFLLGLGRDLDERLALTIAHEVKRSGTWASLERTFFGFEEAEARRRPRP